MKPMPTIRQLQFFVTLCEEGNFHRAAGRLGITQPALSAAIREIENMFGAPMLDRSYRRKTAPTAAGAELLTQARRLIRDYETLCDDVRRVIDPQSWSIRFGVVPTIAPYLMPHVLPLLARDMPRLDIRIIESTSAQIRQRMEEGKIDYALMAFPFDMPGFYQQPLFDEAFACAVSAAADPFADKSAITLEDLAKRKILLLEDGHCLRNHALAACHLAPAQEQKTFQASSLSTLIQMVAHGQGITLLPRMATTHGALPPEITIKPFANPAPTRTIGVVWREKSPRHTDFQSFTRALRGALDALGFSERTQKLKSA